MALLDVGCGPGTITADLAALVKPGPVTAIEPVEEALALARNASGTESVTFAVGDVHDLGFADGTFDVVHAHQVLQHVADPVRALREMRRVTRPGGIVAARDSDYSGFIWYPLLPELDEWMRLYQRAARANGGEPDAGRRLHAWARSAGFTDITATASVWCFASEPDRQWWGGMWADRILESAMARQALDQGLATADDLRRMSGAWRRWAAGEDGWFALPHGEIICRA